jgi:hypothetical protein
MEKIGDLLYLMIGPLQYEFRAHDIWGEKTLGRLRTHLLCGGFSGPPQRVLHLANLGMTAEENEQINRDRLPDRFAALLPADSPRQGWILTGDETGYLSFRHQATNHGLWIFGAITEEYQAPFQLPWPMMFEDIVEKGGGILHGGLIVRNGKGLILTAPPGGGKTTAISRLPSPWSVLADDACLVWPGNGKSFLASPLPTWSMLLGHGETLPFIGRWKIGTVVPVLGIILLQKSDTDRLTPLPVLKVVPALYQALCEHPRVVTNCDLPRMRLFDIARCLAKATPVWRLDATLTGQFWEGLATIVSN